MGIQCYPLDKNTIEEEFLKYAPAYAQKKAKEAVSQTSKMKESEGQNEK